ncbi:glycoside hydrolase family 57 protein [Patescibacteria group bacterium]|nr:glycoside hydrolase family 57 protein [Patescibacteria group bacterium]MBU2260143.1 glycoside hydrolase family 57 protein [Patescibacteria group bacterium]
MPPSVCFYFQVHQPYRLRDLRITDIGSGNPDYFDEEKNFAIFRKVAEKCYLPANALMLEILEKYPDFSIAYSLSGLFLDQCKEYGEDVLESFRKLAATGKVEFLAETYYHSLSSLKSIEEFCDQVNEHVSTIRELFGQTPNVFRNTELIYSNEISQVARMMGFTGILAEGADHILSGRNPNAPFRPPSFRLPAKVQRIIRNNRPLPMRARDITTLCKNYRLSDDIAFRFSDRSWIGFPLTAETFTDWLMESGGYCVNLFMDYETFGEHQWKDTGIFDFLRRLPELWQDRGIRAVTPTTVIKEWKQKNSDVYNAHTAISWADMERDLSAWQGNRIQNAAIDAIYELEPLVKQSKDPTLRKLWRYLQTSDHFYYMSTKYWADGDVHKYFSPYESPYEAYRRYSHAVHDLRSRLERTSNVK